MNTSPIKTHRATQNRLRQYERASLPENFLLLGDAVCAFNPVYGQGMTAVQMLKPARRFSERPVRSRTRKQVLSHAEARE